MICSSLPLRSLVLPIPSLAKAEFRRALRARALNIAQARLTPRIDSAMKEGVAENHISKGRGG